MKKLVLPAAFQQGSYRIPLRTACERGKFEFDQHPAVLHCKIVRSLKAIAS